MRRVNSWTQQEKDILKEHYPKGMSYEHLNKLLPNRTLDAIRGCLIRLNIKREGKCWSDKEIALLKKYYSHCSSQEMKKILPHRTIKAMHTKANMLGISKEDYWSKEEENLLKKHYRSKTTYEELKELFPKRSYNAILHKASKLGIKKGSYIPEKNSKLSRRWTKDEVEFVKKFYDSMTNEELLKLLPGRTISGLKGIVRAHKIPFQKSFKRPCYRLYPWSKYELDTLIQNYNKVANEELMKLLPDRTWDGIRSRMYILGLKRDKYVWVKKGQFKPWHQDEDQILIDNSGKTVDELLALLTFRNREGIIAHARRLNIPVVR